MGKMKAATLITISLFLILINQTESRACKSLEVVRGELAQEFPGIFKYKTLEKLGAEAEEYTTNRLYEIHRLNSNPKLFLKKTKKNARESDTIENLQNLTNYIKENYPEDNIPFQYYVNCIDTGSSLLLFFRQLDYPS